MAETTAAPTGDAESVRDQIVSWFDTWGNNFVAAPLTAIAQSLGIDMEQVCAAVADLATAGRFSVYEGVAGKFAVAATDSWPTAATDSWPTAATDSSSTAATDSLPTHDAKRARVAPDQKPDVLRIVSSTSASPLDPRWNFLYLQLSKVYAIRCVSKGMKSVVEVSMKKMETVYGHPFHDLVEFQKSRLGLPLLPVQLPNTIAVRSTLDENGVAVVAAPPLPVFEEAAGTARMRAVVDELSKRSGASAYDAIIKVQTVQLIKTKVYRDGWAKGVRKGKLWTVAYIVGMGLPQFPYDKLARRRLRHLRAMVVRKPPTVEGGAVPQGQWRDVLTFLPADVRDLAEKLEAMPEIEPSSQYYGVCRRNGKFPMCIRLDDGRHFKNYDDEVEAARAYDVLARPLGRDLNFPDDYVAPDDYDSSQLMAQPLPGEDGEGERRKSPRMEERQRDAVAAALAVAPEPLELLAPDSKLWCRLEAYCPVKPRLSADAEDELAARRAALVGELAAMQLVDEATLGATQRMLATADAFVLGHFADALRSLPGDASKLAVLLSIHTSFQQRLDLCARREQLLS